MRRQISRAALCSLIVLGTLPGLLAAEGELPPEVVEFIPRVAGVFQKIGSGQTDAAYAAFTMEMALPPQHFGPDEVRRHRSSFDTLIGRQRFRMEQLELVSWRQVSSRSMVLRFVGHDIKGPVVFESLIFRYDGRWHMATVGISPLTSRPLDALSAQLSHAREYDLAEPMSFLIQPATGAGQ